MNFALSRRKQGLPPPEWKSRDLALVVGVPEREVRG
jgi:hypothetical protein